MKRLAALLMALMGLLLCGFAPDSPDFECRYVERVADEVLAKLLSPGMSEREKVRAIYRHLVCQVAFDEPVGLDVWRYRAQPGDGAPDYVENRALSPLLFHIGSCEDYAAAMAVLCRRAGLPARYVAGLTISVEGVFVDHAWTAVCVDGKWYHADTQLERNVMKGGRLPYRYFLRDDAYFLADHRWGENLVSYYGHPGGEAQRELLERWTPPPCPEALPSPPMESAPLSPAPDRRALEIALAREKAAYTQRNGALPPLKLDITPPQVYLR